MDKTIALTEARRQFSEIVNEVMYRNSSYVIEKQGKPAAAIVPLEIYEQWKARRQRLIDLIEETRAKNTDADPDQVLADVLDAQQAIRQHTMVV